ncbi:MAG: hypothetical protein HY593_00530, partial [Candidatus Omnitrophica bacterium]|nr:hypothetical protein [Candidatus Omnitrophota bacterium]
RSSLAGRPVRSIAESLGALSLLWLAKGYRFRKRAVRRLAEESGFSREMAEAAVDSIFKELTFSKIWNLLKAELVDPYVLDGFRRNVLTGLLHHAQGPNLITHVLPGNVPQPAVFSLVFGMLIKSANAVKVSSEDRGVLDIYLDSLKAHDAGLARVNFLIPRQAKDCLRDFFALSDLVVAYGHDETLEELRRQIPAKTAFAGYGHRVSFGLYLRGCLTKRNGVLLAEKTAWDVWMVDQRGCLSPSVVYVEEGGETTPLDFARLLKERLRRRRAGLWAVFYDESLKDFPLSPSGRVVRVKAFRGVERLCGALAPFRGYLQAVALEAPPACREAAALQLARLGVNRICRAGRMQSPPLTWHHDGIPNLASWVRWTDLA